MGIFSSPDLIVQTTPAAWRVLALVTSHLKGRPECHSRYCLPNKSLMNVVNLVLAPATMMCSVASKFDWSVATPTLVILDRYVYQLCWVDVDQHIDCRIDIFSNIFTVALISMNTHIVGWSPAFPQLRDGICLSFNGYQQIKVSTIIRTIHENK